MAMACLCLCCGGRGGTVADACCCRCRMAFKRHGCRTRRMCTVACTWWWAPVRRCPRCCLPVCWKAHPLCCCRWRSSLAVR